MTESTSATQGKGLRPFVHLPTPCFCRIVPVRPLFARITAISDSNAIFLSYSSEDAEVASRLCDSLRAAGLEVWYDRSELRGGDAWDSSIRDQIKDCAVFIPIISASTQQRSEGYFRLEWKLAVDRSYLMSEDRSFFFPVVIDDTSERLARVPDRFRQLQWTQISDESSMEAFARHVHGMMFEEAPAHRELRSPSPAAPTATESRPFSGAGFWVAVLPFTCHPANPDLEALAEGIADDLVIGLSRFSYLRVMGRGATGGFTSGSGDARQVGRELGARYLMVGSLRQAGAAIRVSAQLVDTASGVSLWAEHYARAYAEDSIFELQDELVPRIVSTVADVSGVLPRSLHDSVRDRSPADLDPYEAVLSSFGYFSRVTSEAFEHARTALEAALEKAPNYADAWAMLAVLCGQAHGQRFDREIDYLTQAVSAAQKAVDLAPSNHFAHFALAQALFFRKEFESFRNAALKAATLNPMDGNSIAFMGELLVYANELEKGREFSAKAKELNPHYPGWYWYADYYLAFREGDYRQALSCALKVNLPEHWGYHLFQAAAYGQLGEIDSAQIALEAVFRIRPDLATTIREDLERWFEPDYVDRIMDGLRKAGLREETGQ